MEMQILQRRIAILFVLCNLYGPDTLERNPFLSFFLELLDSLDNDTPEKLTVQCILCCSVNMVCKLFYFYCRTMPIIDSHPVFSRFSRVRLLNWPETQSI